MKEKSEGENIRSGDGRSESEKATDFNKEEAGFHVVCGLSPKNGLTGTIRGEGGIAGDITKSAGTLDLSGLSSLLVADMDYFVEHHEEVLRMVKEQIERRDYFREHPEELEEKTKEARARTGMMRLEMINKQIERDEREGK